MKEVIREIFLDQVPAITAADHKVVYPMAEIDLHNVPKNGL